MGPLVVTYWATVKRIYEMTVVKGMSNATANTICVGILAEQVAAYNYANSVHILCANSIAGNVFVGGA